MRSEKRLRGEKARETSEEAGQEWDAPKEHRKENSDAYSTEPRWGVLACLAEQKGVGGVRRVSRGRDRRGEKGTTTEKRRHVISQLAARRLRQKEAEEAERRGEEEAVEQPWTIQHWRPRASWPRKDRRERECFLGALERGRGSDDSKEEQELGTCKGAPGGKKAAKRPAGDGMRLCEN
ncbi:hypothetical protein ERJ75_001831300 [Trypanosoma vivax]|nr:hypothetical protein ERJ75_001831300 [Trypanosoma vivax]